MKNNFQKLPLVLSSIFFVLLSVALVFIYRVTESNNQKALEGTIVWQAEASRRDDIRLLDLSLRKVADDRAQLETHFAKSSDVVPFLDAIEKLAPPVGAVAQVDSVVALPESIGLSVGLTATGSFQAVYKFLTLLENSPYELDFNSMDIHRVAALDASGNNSANANWEAVFKIQLLSFVP